MPIHRPQLRRLPMNGNYCRLCGYRRDVHDRYAHGDHEFEPCTPKPKANLPWAVDLGNGVVVWRREEDWQDNRE